MVKLIKATDTFWEGARSQKPTAHIYSGMSPKSDKPYDNTYRQKGKQQ